MGYAEIGAVGNGIELEFEAVNATIKKIKKIKNSHKMIKITGTVKRILSHFGQSVHTQVKISPAG